MEKTKVVTSLPCERETLSERLRHSGFNKAEVVLSKYLEFDKNETTFKKWLTESCGVSDTQSETCYKCLQEWCQAHL